MSFCINPSCPHPGDPGPQRFCRHCGSPLELEGRYRVLRLLGEGNFGKTFEVSDGGSTRKVLKVLTISDPNCLNNAQCVQQAISLFQREAGVLLQLNHPGIPRVEPGGYFTIQPRNSQELHCLVMEKIEGMNLQQYLILTGNRPIENSLAIQWLTELVTILQEVHGQSFFHRDIKPTNIMVRDGHLVLIDFGAVKQLATSISPPGTRIYTTGYAPQEQIAGQAVPRSDFFALGRTFVYLLTGTEPMNFPEQNGELIWRGNASQVPKLLADLLDHLMAPLPQNRPLNTQEILSSLADIERRLQNQPQTTQISGPASNSSSSMVYAGFWRRTVAGIIDLFVLAVSCSVIGLGLGFTIYNSMPDATDEQLGFIFLAIWMLAIVLFSWLYHAVLVSSAKQGTFGKMAMRVIVTDMNGDKISFGTATARFFSSMLSLFTLGIGYFMAGYTEKEQALHDMIANCLVIEAPMISTSKSSQYAGFWKRFVATSIDGSIVIIYASIISKVLSVMAGGTPQGAYILYQFFLFLLGWPYYASMESSPRRATLGKQAVGIAVTDINGNKLSFGRATGRYFAQSISSYPTLFIGYIIAGFTKKKQALHDKIAGAIVVTKKKNSVGVVIGMGCFGMIVLVLSLLLASALLSAPVPSFLNQAIQAKQAEAKQDIGEMNRAQQAFYIENNKFADELSKLELGIDSETENYSYSIDADTYGDAVISTAAAKDSELKSYTGTVVVLENYATITIICETDEPSPTPPEVPELREGELYCPSGSSKP